MPQPIIVTLSFMVTAMPVACIIQDFPSSESYLKSVRYSMLNL